MRALFFLLITLASVGGLAILLAILYFLGQSVTRSWTLRNSRRRGPWSTYTETLRGQVVIGIERVNGRSSLPERQEMFQLPLSSLTDDAQQELYVKQAEADETAAVLNMRHRD